MKKLKPLPNFKNEDQEREFWDKHELSDYFDLSQAKKMVFPNLKPTSHSISLRLPDYLLNRIKMEANQRDIPYQSLIKIYLSEKITEIHSRKKKVA
jgi:predicted DNA binding CopG/RHH family protein